MQTLHSEDSGRVGADKTKLAERAATRFAGSRARKFLSYYRPYQGLLLADLLCAVIIAAAALLLPVCANFVTKNLLVKQGAPGALHKIYGLGVVMLALVWPLALLSTSGTKSSENRVLSSWTTPTGAQATRAKK